MSKTFLKQGTRIQFDVQNIKGTGTIVGVASAGDALHGTLYIVQPDEKINNEVYDYTHIVVYEHAFTALMDMYHLCGCCGHQPSQELHTCPHILELEGVDLELCDCCEACESKCGDDV